MQQDLVNNWPRFLSARLPLFPVCHGSGGHGGDAAGLRVRFGRLCSFWSALFRLYRQLPHGIWLVKSATCWWWSEFCSDCADGVCVLCVASLCYHQGSEQRERVFFFFGAFKGHNSPSNQPLPPYMEMLGLFQKESKMKHYERTTVMEYCVARIANYSHFLILQHKRKWIILCHVQSAQFCVTLYEV